jgi:hypothetical protein
MYYAPLSTSRDDDDTSTLPRQSQDMSEHPSYSEAISVTTLSLFHAIHMTVISEMEGRR